VGFIDYLIFSKKFVLVLDKVKAIRFTYVYMIKQRWILKPVLMFMKPLPSYLLIYVIFGYS